MFNDPSNEGTKHSQRHVCNGGRILYSLTINQIVQNDIMALKTVNVTGKHYKLLKNGLPLLAVKISQQIHQPGRSNVTSRSPVLTID